jgi:hypothetical protein
LFNLHLGVQPYVKRVEYLDRPLQRDSKVFVSLVTGDLGLMHIESFCQLPLRDSLGDTRRNQERPEPAKILQLVEFATLEALIAFHFFLELQVEGLHRVDHSLDLLIAQSGFLQSRSMIREPVPLAGKTRRCFLILALIANHD